MRFLQKAYKWVEGLYRVYSSTGGFHEEEQKLMRKYYLPENPKLGREGQQVVVMVDGRVTHGGLADRIRGIASVYDYCKHHGIDFRINYYYPFPLEQYLAPATKNWCIASQDISYHPDEARPVMLLCDQLPNKHHRKYLKHMLKKYPNHQLHVYTNTQFADKHFKENFSELFCPVVRLQETVDEQVEKGGGKFVAMVFRFQQLLGDFKEGNYKVLSEVERETLIEKCITKVHELRERNHPNERVLITSDSITFLQRVEASLPYVFTIPGKVVHMDYTLDANFEIYMKSFVDLLTLSYAQKVYLLKTGDMYKSGFAKRAAKISNAEYQEIIF